MGDKKIYLKKCKFSLKEKKITIQTNRFKNKIKMRLRDQFILGYHQMPSITAL